MQLLCTSADGQSESLQPVASGPCCHRRFRTGSLGDGPSTLYYKAEERRRPHSRHDGEGDLRGPFELVELDHGAHLEGGGAVHAEGEHERPVGGVVAERDLADDVAPDADRDHEREPEGGGGPREGDQPFDERRRAARRGRDGRAARRLEPASTVIATAPAAIQAGGSASVGSSGWKVQRRNTIVMTIR